MRVLLDECVPRKFRNSFSGHECATAQEAGLARKKNGELLALAEAGGFDVLLTMDQGLVYEQNLRGRKIADIVVRAHSNRLRDLLPHAEACRTAIVSISPGQVAHIGP